MNFKNFLNVSRVITMLMASAVLARALPLDDPVEDTEGLSLNKDDDLVDYQEYASKDAGYLYPDVSDFNIEPNFSFSNLTDEEVKFGDEQYEYIYQGDEDAEDSEDTEEVDLPSDSINAAGKTSKFQKAQKAKNVHGTVKNIFGKKKPKNYQRSPIIDAIAKNTGKPKKAIIENIDKSLKVFSGEAPAVQCKDTKKGYNGLCVNSQNRAIYKNTDRSKYHIFRSYLVPLQALVTKEVSLLIRWYFCLVPTPYSPFFDYFHCKAWKWQNSLVDVLFASMLAIGYQEATGEPFAARAVNILNVYSRIGYKMAGYHAVSFDGEVVELKKMPQGFDIRYIYSGYGSPEWDARNLSMAIYPGNKASELGVSVISKPWDLGPVDPGILTPVSDLNRFHWKYTVKLDTDKIRYTMDQSSPEEMIHQIRGFVETQVQNYMTYGGGMFTDNHLMLIQPRDIMNGTEIEDDNYDHDDNMEVFEHLPPSADDQTLMDLDFNGLIVRVTLEEKSEHNIQW